MYYWAAGLQCVACMMHDATHCCTPRQLAVAVSAAQVPTRRRAVAPCVALAATGSGSARVGKRPVDRLAALRPRASPALHCQCVPHRDCGAQRLSLNNICSFDSSCNNHGSVHWVPGATGSLRVGPQWTPHTRTTQHTVALRLTVTVPQPASDSGLRVGSDTGVTVTRCHSSSTSCHCHCHGATATATAIASATGPQR